MKKNILTLLVVLFSLSGMAQKNVKLTIKHLLDGSQFTLGQSSQNNLGNDFNISRIDYYISGISIIHDGGAVTAVPDTYLLIKGDQNYEGDLGVFNVTSVEGIKFSIGVDTPINHEDPSLQPAGHPLAFQSPAMHWGWTSGYRFVALEGMGGSSLNTLYQLHGLFDQNYFEQTVMVTGIDTSNEIIINLDADYKEALHGIDISTGPIMHGVNRDDLTMLENFRDKVFSAGLGFPLSIESVAKNAQVKVYPIPSEGSVTVLMDEITGNYATNIVLYDLMGRSITSFPTEGRNDFEINVSNNGFYFLSIYSDSHLLASKPIVIK